MNLHLKNLKYNPFLVFLYNEYLNLKTKSTEAYIFVATTGRSGSKSLSKIFEVNHNAICFHEPYPIMIYEDFLDETARDVFLKRKRINIKRAAIGYKYYVETNHQFIKHFAQYAIEEFESKIRIIHLYREPMSVAKSFFSINSIPGISRNGRNYLLDPQDKNNIIPYRKVINNSGIPDHPFVRCVWYWYETEARVYKLKNQYPGLRIVDIKTEELNDPVALKKMIESLDLSDDFKIENMAGTRMNLKNELKVNQISEQEAIDLFESFRKALFSEINQALGDYLRRFETPVYS